jgi:hypothetical protein
MLLRLYRRYIQLEVGPAAPQTFGSGGGGRLLIDTQPDSGVTPIDMHLAPVTPEAPVFLNSTLGMR